MTKVRRVCKCSWNRLKTIDRISCIRISLQRVLIRWAVIRLPWLSQVSFRFRGPKNYRQRLSTQSQLALDLKIKTLRAIKGMKGKKNGDHSKSICQGKLSTLRIALMQVRKSTWCGSTFELLTRFQMGRKLRQKISAQFVRNLAKSSWANLNLWRLLMQIALHAYWLKRNQTC